VYLKDMGRPSPCVKEKQIEELKEKLLFVDATVVF
jgi:hypothetical protein